MQINSSSRTEDCFPSIDIDERDIDSVIFSLVESISTPPLSPVKTIAYEQPLQKENFRIDYRQPGESDIFVDIISPYQHTQAVKETIIKQSDEPYETKNIDVDAVESSLLHTRVLTQQKTSALIKTFHESASYEFQTYFITKNEPITQILSRDFVNSRLAENLRVSFVNTPTSTKTTETKNMSIERQEVKPGSRKRTHESSRVSKNVRIKCSPEAEACVWETIVPNKLSPSEIQNEIIPINENQLNRSVQVSFLEILRQLFGT